MNFDIFARLKFTKLINFRFPRIAKTAVFRTFRFLKIDFTQNLSDRKILKFPHFGYVAAFQFLRQMLLRWRVLLFLGKEFFFRYCNKVKCINFFLLYLDLFMLHEKCQNFHVVDAFYQMVLRFLLKNSFCFFFAESSIYRNGITIEICGFGYDWFISL